MEAGEPAAAPASIDGADRIDRSPLVAHLGRDRLPGGTPPGELLGGKGASLAELIGNGYPVPDTGVVTTAAYRAVADHPSIAELLTRIARGGDGDTDDPVVPADQVDAVFAELAVARPVATAVADLARTVGGGGPVAVRSSATVEDLHGSSFAGQYRSLLDVDSSDPDEVLEAVKAVWASLWHPAPTAYRRAFGIDDAEAAMAVVVMRMIPATSAGVVFTLDPGGSGGARVEAVAGLGEALVSGQATPEAWVVPRPDAAAGTGTGSTLPTRDTDSGLAPTAPPAGSTAPAELPPAPATALRLAVAVEGDAGVPQDIEWAAVGDDVYVVQARPITVLEDHDGFDTRLDDHELTTAGIVEMVPGVLPPLRWEVNRFLLEEAFRSVLDSLGAIRGTAAEDRPFVRRVRGRVAIDFDQLRDAASGIPGAVRELEAQYFGRPDDEPAAGGTGEAASGDTAAGNTTAGNTTAGNTAADNTAAGNTGRDASGRRIRSRLAALHRDLTTLQTRRKVIDQAEVLIRTTVALRRRRPVIDRWADGDLLGYERRLIDLGARGLAAELGVAAAGAAAYQRLEAHLAGHLGPAEGSRAAQLVTGRSGVAIERLGDASAAIFAGPTWHEIGARPPVLPGDFEAENEERWQQLRARVKALPGWTRRRVLTGGVVDVRMHLLHRLVEDVVDQLHRREAAKAAILELGGEVRRVHLELGRRLVERGALELPGDVELLTSGELQRTLAGDGAVAPDGLRRRRNWLSRYEAEGTLPVRFRGVPDRKAEPLPEGDVLHGWAASPGRRQGRARVVRSATGRLDVGEILVAEATDASWSPLFMRAGAVVVERGGPLSHAAILARELGLPAVLNVAGATGLLGGCLVSVDGDQGAVVIESREPATTEPVTTKAGPMEPAAR